MTSSPEIAGFLILRLASGLAIVFIVAATATGVWRLCKAVGHEVWLIRRDHNRPLARGSVVSGNKSGSAVEGAARSPPVACASLRRSSRALAQEHRAAR